MIRRAKPDDASSMAAIGMEVWLNTYLRDGVNAFFADYALHHFTKTNFQAILKDDSSTVWVSEHGVGIDGYLVLSSGRPAPAPGCSDLEIETLYVRPRHQGLGTGARLLDVATKFGAEAGYENIWLTVNAENDRALAFYLAKRFVRVGETHFQIGEARYPNIVLRLDLRATQNR